MRLSRTLSLRMSNMGALCSILIVALHSGFKGLTAVAVPYFFLAAGYFLAGHAGEEGWWKREVLKRVKSLLIPLWAWGLIGLSFTGVIQHGMSVVGYQLNVESVSWSHRIFAATGLHFMTNMGPLWFVRTLFVFVCISPFLMGGGIFVQLSDFRYLQAHISSSSWSVSRIKIGGISSSMAYH